MVTALTAKVPAIQQQPNTVAATSIKDNNAATPMPNQPKATGEPKVEQSQSTKPLGVTEEQFQQYLGDCSFKGSKLNTQA